MNVLVTGANGQLGTELRNESINSPHHYIFTDVNDLPGVQTEHLDITDIQAIRKLCKDNIPDVIVNCAAYTNVDAAEDNFHLADLLNRQAVANLARVASENNATLIHISTDYVFAGDAESPYKEDDKPDPQSVYGSTKLAGEQAVLDSGCGYIIFRTAWLYSPYGKNFVKTMMNLTSQKDSIKVVADQVGTPTYAADLAALIAIIIDENLLDNEGIYHFTDEGVTNWHDFAEAVRELCGNDCDVQPCTSEEYPSKVRRPAYSVLDKTKVKDTFGIAIPEWRDSLVHCINRLKEQ